MINPLKNNILIEIEKVKSKSGFLMASDDKDKQGYGTVKEIWQGCERVKVGDQVFFKKYKPEKIVIDDAEFYLADENDILAIYTEAK